MGQFRENFWTDGMTDEQTLFHRTLSATVGSPKRDIFPASQSKNCPNLIPHILSNGPAVKYKRPQLSVEWWYLKCL